MTLAKLRAMCIAQLVAEYDRRQDHDFTQSMYLDEIQRRSQESRTRTMLGLTIVMAVLTAVVTAATVVNLCRALR